MGWGGAVIKTLKPDHMDIKNAAPQFATLRNKKGHNIGFENFELVTTLSLATWVDYIKDIKQDYPDRVLIGSIMAEVEKEAWQNLAKQVADAGVDALELNFSCPHGMPEKGIGAAIGQDPAITKMITEWVAEVVNIPLIVKLSPNVTSIEEIGEHALAGGADALAAINTVSSLTSVDIHTFMPNPNVSGATTYGGYSGLGVKPIGLKAVSSLAKTIDLPISGMGGITTWEHAVEYLLVGANHVQICTEVMLNGFEIIDGLISGLENYMVEKGFEKVSDIVGLALPRIKSFEQLDLSGNVRARVDKALCVNCLKCCTICKESAKGAIAPAKDNCISIDQDKCDGCSLCTHICPVGALSVAAI